MTSLGLNAGSLSGDIFTNNLINGAFEIAARIVTPFLLEWKVFGRRNSLILMFFICGASCLLSLVLKEFSDCVPIKSGNCFDDETILPSCNQAMIDASKVQINIDLFNISKTPSVVLSRRMIKNIFVFDCFERKQNFLGCVVIVQLYQKRVCFESFLSFIK